MLNKAVCISNGVYEIRQLLAITYIEPGAFGPHGLLIESVQGLSKSIIFVKKKCNYFWAV